MLHAGACRGPAKVASPIKPITVLRSSRVVISPRPRTTHDLFFAAPTALPLQPGPSPYGSIRAEVANWLASVHGSPERSPGDCQPCRRRKSPHPTARDDGQTNPAHDTTRSGLRRQDRGSDARPASVLQATTLQVVLHVRPHRCEPTWQLPSSSSSRSVHSCSIHPPPIQLYR